MDLNLQNKGVILSAYTAGIGQQIKKTLNNEGATVIKNNNENSFEYIDHKAIKICALINLLENNNSGNYEDLLLSLYDSNRLANNFTIVNIGTQSSLGIKGDSYENEILNFGKNTKALEQRLKLKTIMIVHPEYDIVNRKNKENGNTICLDNFTQATNDRIADTVAFIISEKSNLNNGQIIFIDKGTSLSDQIDIDTLLD